MFLLLFSSLFVIQVLGGSTFAVTFLDYQQPYTPTESQSVSIYVSNTPACCTNGSDIADGPCYTNDGTTYLPNTGQGISFVWYGCAEPSEYCIPYYDVPTTKTLFTVVSPSLGNCSIIANRYSEIEIDEYGFPYCAYPWYRTIRNCGTLYCYWNDALATITVQCNSPFCQTLLPVDHCNIPWSPDFEPSGYPIDPYTTHSTAWRKKIDFQ